MPPFQLEVSVVGFCLVQEAEAAGGFHRVIAVDPDVHLEAHSMSISTRCSNIKVVSANLRNSLFNYHGRTYLHFPPRARFDLRNPDRSPAGWVPRPVRAASLSDLGSVGVRDGVGEGRFTRFELGRVGLPYSREHSHHEWRVLLGFYTFQGSDEERPVADRFVWWGGYGDDLRVAVYLAESEEEWGYFILGSDDGRVAVNLGCNVLAPQPSRHRDAFDNVLRYRGVARGNLRTPKFERRQYLLLGGEDGKDTDPQIPGVSIGSASCPPVKVG